MLNIQLTGKLFSSKSNVSLAFSMRSPSIEPGGKNIFAYISMLNEIIYVTTCNFVYDKISLIMYSSSNNVFRYQKLTRTVDDKHKFARLIFDFNFRNKINHQNV